MHRMQCRSETRPAAAFYSNGSANKLKWPIGDTVYEANKSHDIEDKIFSNK